MSPEYTTQGIFSVKSDTYSFGILLLEIVSGLKISASPHLLMDHPSLIAYVSVTSSILYFFNNYIIKINKKFVLVFVSGMELMERWNGKGFRRHNGCGELLTGRSLAMHPYWTIVCSRQPK